MKLNLVHFNVKYDIWWKQLHLFCNELTDQIQCSLSKKAKTCWYHKFKNRGYKYFASEASRKKIGAQNCRILCYAYFGILGNLPSKKNLPPVFNFLLPPTFPRGICIDFRLFRHQSIHHRSLQHGRFILRTVHHKARKTISGRRGSNRFRLSQSYDISSPYLCISATDDNNDTQHMNSLNTVIDFEAKVTKRGKSTVILGGSESGFSIADVWA